MISLTLGVLAALLWGLHDFCVRYVSARSAPLPLLVTVLGMGSLLLLPLAAGWGDWAAMSGRAFGLAALSGLAYMMGCIALYNAFAIGPVRLVAPILGSFPILSLAWAAARGQPVGMGQWLAVLAIVGGIAAVGIWSHKDGAAQARAGAAIGWAVLGAAGWAATFAIGQAATVAGSPLPVQLVGRVVAALVLGCLILALRVEWRIDRRHWPVLVGMAFLDVTALGAVLTAGGQPRPEFAAVASSLFGLVTILLAWRFLREPMARAQWLGVAVVFAGIAYLAI